MRKNFFRISISVCLLIFFSLLPVYAQANYDAKIQYICSLMSMTAYNDKYGELARDTLTSYGWDFNSFNDNVENPAANFFIAHNDNFVPGESSYLLSVRGTNDLNDVSSDMKISLVPFGGNTPEGFDAYLAQPTNAQMPMVHSGFNQYVQTAFFTKKGDDGQTIGEKLVSILHNDPHAHLYITGHSLGGAVAVLTAARLNSIGVDPAQISVVTFGAPVVGNEAFAKTYGPSINLSRIILAGDPVRNLVQLLNPNYQQFGKEIKYSTVPSYDDKLSHKILLYVDASLRRYYDESKDTVEPPASDGKVLFTKPVCQLEAGQSNENIDFYIYAVLKDDISHYIDGTVWSDSTNVSPTDSNIKYIVNTDITISRQKYVQNSFYVSTTYTVYDAPSGKLISAFSIASNTAELTPIEAVLYNNLKLADELKATLI